MSTFKEKIIAAATIVGSAAACIAIGYSFGKDTNDGLLNFLREKNLSAEKIENNLRAEISSLKLELQSRQISINKEMASEKNLKSEASDLISEKIFLTPGKSETTFSGKFSISLIQVDFSGDPLRHKAIASISTPSHANKILDKVDVGYTTEIDGFEVRVFDLGFQSATFQVTRLDSKI